MTKFTIFILFSSICFLFILIPARALTVEIMYPVMIIEDNNIFIDTGLTDIKELENTINSGIEKEIIFTIELIKAWNFWPDEFVVSKKIHKIIKYDDLRGQYLASSNDGTKENKKKFKNFDASMKDWFFTTREVKLANIKELDPGNYYIRVVSESKSRKLPPAIGILMLFIPEVEMSLAKESQVLVTIGN